MLFIHTNRKNVTVYGYTETWLVAQTVKGCENTLLIASVFTVKWEARSLAESERGERDVRV